MNMKKTLLVILTGITLASPVAGAATCRAGAAAEAGSRAAWERARTASQAWSQRENDVASSLAVLPVPHQGHQYHSSAVPQPGQAPPRPGKPGL